MAHNAKRDIAIIGGGIGGLTAALAFARQGARTTVYEQAPALTEVGAGLQITPNGARALNALGLERALGASGLTAEAVVPMDASNGHEITRFDLTAQTPPYRFYHRAALIDILARACAAAGVNVVLDTHVTDLQEDGRFMACGTQVRPDLTIGADGLHSVVRPMLNGAADPFFTGQVAWRAVIKSDAVDPVARIWMAHGRHVVTYPLAQGRLNIVAVQERSDWAAEGWHHPDDAANLQAAFAGCCDELRGILSGVETTNLWGLFRHPVAQIWHAGRVAILGDAAHPTLPFLAQGANLAIEDAFVLARICNEKSDLEQGLAAYQALRRPRVLKAINAANSNARNYHFGGAKRLIAQTGLRMIGKAAPDLFLRRLGWLYDHDVTA